MKTPLSFVLVVSVFAAFPLHEALAGITPISSSLSLHAEANAGIGLVQNDQSVAQTSGLNPLSTSVFAQAFNGSLSAATESDATATWTSAGAGQFSIHTKFVTDNLSQYHDSRVATGSPGWFYTFNSDQPATLTLNYGISYAGSYAYSTILVFNQMIGSSLVTQVEFPRPPSSGIRSFAINPNVNYTLQIFDNSNLNQFLPQFTSNMNATFSFQITPVPEPSAFAIAVLGATVLRVLRRRKLSENEGVGSRS
jgi:hypothetical protein